MYCAECFRIKVSQFDPASTKSEVAFPRLSTRLRLQLLKGERNLHGERIGGLVEGYALRLPPGQSHDDQIQNDDGHAWINPFTTNNIHSYDNKALSPRMIVNRAQ